jgi:hypothetical protein
MPDPTERHTVRVMEVTTYHVSCSCGWRSADREIRSNAANDAFHHHRGKLPALPGLGDDPQDARQPLRRVTMRREGGITRAELDALYRADPHIEDD